ncbi:hypothetical protein [Sedimenticola hydrogenitrophicus]|uniref:hypothetical protein n=1 Tax=Sedimenticola hydrogenitrophicus TaxID=2967975 RepID=UPI0023AF236D
MAIDSLIYSLIQVLHNLGAALVLGAPVFWLLLAPPLQRARPVLLILAVAWALQGITGAGFGSASWWLYGRLPDLHPIAFAALLIKIGCVTCGLLFTLYLIFTAHGAPGRLSWGALAVLAAIALSAAAVLRWNA